MCKIDLYCYMLLCSIRGAFCFFIRSKRLPCFASSWSYCRTTKTALSPGDGLFASELRTESASDSAHSIFERIPGSISERTKRKKHSVIEHNSCDIIWVKSFPADFPADPVGPEIPISKGFVSVPLVRFSLKVTKVVCWLFPPFSLRIQSLWILWHWGLAKRVAINRVSNRFV